MMGSLERGVGQMESQLGNHMGQLGNHWQSLGDHFDNLGSQLEDQMEQLGGQMETLGSRIGSQFGSFGGSVGKVGDEGGIGGMGGISGRGGIGGVGGLGGIRGLGGMGGLLDHIHTGMGRMSNPFGSHIMGVFGGQGPRKSWWEKENVCKQTDVEEEEDEKKEDGGNFSFQMEVHSCSEEEDRYVCTHKSGSQAGLTTVKTIYKCCHGFRLVSRDSCVAVEEMKPLEETLEELGGGQFLDLLVKNDLARQLVNMTVFMPTDEAVEEWLKEMEGLGQPQGYTVYRVDDGLLGKRKKRSITLFDEPQPQEVLAGHLTPGFFVH